MDPTPESVIPLTDEACRISHRLRLGVPVLNDVRRYRCTCGRKLETGDHLLDCGFFTEAKRTLRHDKVVTILIDYIRKAGGIATDIEKSKHRRHRNDKHWFRDQVPQKPCFSNI